MAFFSTKAAKFKEFDDENQSMIPSYGIWEGIGIFADFANTCTASQENLPAMLFPKAFPESSPLS